MLRARDALQGGARKLIQVRIAGANVKIAEGVGQEPRAPERPMRSAGAARADTNDETKGQRRRRSDRQRGCAGFRTPRDRRRKTHAESSATTSMASATRKTEDLREGGTGVGIVVDGEKNPRAHMPTNAGRASPPMHRAGSSSSARLARRTAAENCSQRSRCSESRRIQRAGLSASSREADGARRPAQQLEPEADSDTVEPSDPTTIHPPTDEFGRRAGSE
jgi:hypothetical protein